MLTDVMFFTLMKKSKSRGDPSLVFKKKKCWRCNIIFFSNRSRILGENYTSRLLLKLNIDKNKYVARTRNTREIKIIYVKGKNGL